MLRHHGVNGRFKSVDLESHIWRSRRTPVFRVAILLCEMVYMRRAADISLRWNDIRNANITPNRSYTSHKSVKDAMEEKVSPTTKDVPQFIPGWRGWGFLTRQRMKTDNPTRHTKRVLH